MNTVYKYKLPVTDRSVIAMPKIAKILHIDWQEPDGPDMLTIWAKVDTGFGQMGNREFIITGTGHPLPSKDRHRLVHLATVKAPMGLVWHVWRFEEGMADVR